MIQCSQYHNVQKNEEDKYVYCNQPDKKPKDGIYYLSSLSLTNSGTEGYFDLITHFPSNEVELLLNYYQIVNYY